MDDPREENRRQSGIKILSLVYLFLVFAISILLFHYSSDRDATMALSIAAAAAAMLFVFLLIFQFKKLNAAIDSHHELLQREAKILIKRDWNLTQALEKLKKEKDKAIILEKLKSDFVTVMAHKLRTPLSKIKWALNSLESIELPRADKDALLKQSIDSNEHLIKLVNELLNVTLLEEGAFAYTFSKFSLAEMTGEIIKGLEFAIESKKINLTFSSAPSVDFNLKMDKDKLMVAIGNVIDNAIKYSAAEKTVEVSLRREADKFILSVSNSGAGIPIAEQKEVFKKFFRGEKAIPMHTEGFGLGLYFSKEIIEEHGGTITFESTPGEKTTFYITLPAGK